MTRSPGKSTAMIFIILMGIVSLFADMTYEGARSITGQFLALLGASGAIVGAVSGFGEFIGYGFRLVSGYLSDRTGRYWLFTIIGFAINLLAVPLLAFAGSWQLAAVFIIAERFGKALRTPSRDALLSYATHQVGHGWGFGLHEALDQIGAIVGPLCISLILFFTGSYQLSFLFLLIPALWGLSVLLAARYFYPTPQDLELQVIVKQKDGFGGGFRLYVAAVSCVAAGFVDFPLIAYHFEKSAIMSPSFMPVIFSVAMAASGVSAPLFGRLYDKKGISILISAILISCAFPALAFLGGIYAASAGVVLWGIGLGAQASVMRAVVADRVPKEKRGSAYGSMNFWFGLSWFLGSALMGYLYDMHPYALVAFSIGAQLAAIPLLAISKR